MKRIVTRLIAVVLGAAITTQTAFVSPVTAFAAEENAFLTASGEGTADSEEPALDKSEENEIQDESDITGENKVSGDDDGSNADTSEDPSDEETAKESGTDGSDDEASEDVISEETTDETSEESSEELLDEEDSLEEDALTQTQEEALLVGAASGKVGDNVTYTINGSVITLSGSGSTYNYNLSDNRSPFSLCDNISKIVVGEGITTLGDYLFARVNNRTSITKGTHLTSVSLPGTLTRIGKYACDTMWGDNLDIVIPGKVSYIGDRAFGGTFRNVTLQEGITTIQKSAFCSCKLENLKLPDTLTTIEEDAFATMELKGELNIPAGVKTIKSGAFRQIDKTRAGSFAGNMPNIADDAFAEDLIVMVYPAGNSTWSDSAVKALSDRLKTVTFRKKGTVVSNKCGENITWAISGDTLTLTGSGAMTDFTTDNQAPWMPDASKIRNLKIDSRITTIGDYSFYCFNLGTVTLPSGITRIGHGAFYRSTVTSCRLPKGVTFIGDKAFYKAREVNLGGITFNSNLTYVGDGAFYDCAKLNATLPKLNCIEYIGSDAFELVGDFKVTSLTFPNTLKTIGDAAFRSCSSSKATIVLPSSLSTLGRYAFSSNANFDGDVVIPAGVKVVGDAAFQETNITSVTMTGNVEKIGFSAFQDCKKLTKAVVGEKVKSIGSGAFSGDTALVTIEGFEGVEYYGGRAFENCTGIKAFTFGKNKCSLDYSVFKGSNVKTYTFKGEFPSLSGRDTWEGAPANPTVNYPRNIVSWVDVTAEKLGMSSLNPKLVPYGPEIVYTVTFKNGNDKNAQVIETRKLKMGEVLYKPADPTMAHRQFKRWIDESTGKAFKFGEKTLRNITLYAEWNEDTYNIRFSAEGGKSYSIRTVTGAYGSKLQVPDFSDIFPEKDYVFSGWSRTINSGHTAVGEIVDLSDYKITKDEEFYGIYTKRSKPADPDKPINPDKPVEPGKPTEPEDLSGIHVDIKGKASVYSNGKVCMPETVSVYDGDQLLTLGKDYTLKAINATNAGTATLVVTFKGNYTGTIKKDYTIAPVELKIKDFLPYPPMYAYDGKLHKGKPKVNWMIDGKAVTLKEGRDYTLNYYGEDLSDSTEDEEASEKVAFKSPGVYLIGIQGKNNFTGELATVVIIEDAVSLNKVSITGIRNMPYTGKEVVLDSIKVKYGKKELVQGVDYAVGYMDNVDVGTATVIINASSESGLAGSDPDAVKFIGYREFKFKITGTPITKAKVNVSTAPEIYTGSEIRKNDLKLVYTASKGAEPRELKGIEKKSYDNLSSNARRNYDYTFEYVNNVNKGTAKIVIRGVNGFTGSVTKSFTIKSLAVGLDEDYSFIAKNGKKTGTICVEMDSTTRYQKGGAKPVPNVYHKNGTGYVLLQSGKDYTVSYAKNTAIGTAGMTITGKGNFAGKIVGSFEIVRGSSKDFTVTATDVAFRKKAGINATKLAVKDLSGKVLAVNRDYTYKITYGNGKAFDPKKDVVPAGAEMKVTVTPMGNYDGSPVDTTFIVYGLNISSAKLVAGTNIAGPRNTKVNFKLMMGKDELKEGVDYTVVSSTDPTKAGICKVTVKGMGNFGGTRVLNIKVAKKSVTAKEK
ncbi:MAG: leucine-rich repeat protein [Butyrivibrio sp.]|nr:leucine-rich repeat protein [Butyrivibrio sp.]